MTKANILVVEDEGIVAQEIKSRLEKAGYSVCGVVHDGERAVTDAEALTPDLVLMDIRLKGQNGRHRGGRTDQGSLQLSRSSISRRTPIQPPLNGPRSRSRLDMWSSPLKPVA